MRKDNQKQRDDVHVEVNLIRTDWLFTGKSRSKINSDFLETLYDFENFRIDSEPLYTSNFVKYLLQPFLMLGQKLITWIFIPFIIQSVFCIYYYSKMVQEDFNNSSAEINNQQEFTNILNGFCTIVIFLLTIYFLLIQCHQMSQILGQENPA